jgi:branched-chain amino acid transport system substrate-binding protein
MKRFLILLVIVLLVLAACSPPEAETPAESGESTASESTASDSTEAAPAESAPAESEAAPAETVEVIKVGALYPLTGPDAGWAGDPYIKSHQMAIDEINAAGGISCLGGAQLELVKGDTQGKAEAGNSEMERLITQEGVIAVMGSALSGTTIPATEIAERNSMPYIVPNALDGTITDRGLEYVFQTVSTLQQWGADDAEWVKDQGAQTAVITVPNFTFGAEVEEVWKNGIEEQGIELLGSFTYEGDAQDFTDTILRVKQLDPDVGLRSVTTRPPKWPSKPRNRVIIPRWVSSRWDPVLAAPFSSMKLVKMLPMASL